MGILELSGGHDRKSRGPHSVVRETPFPSLSDHLTQWKLVRMQRRKDDAVSHIVVVSELYGEDLLDYLDRRDRKEKPVNKLCRCGCVDQSLLLIISIDACLS